MYDSFWMGVSFSYVVRLATFRALRWPLTSGSKPITQPRLPYSLISLQEALFFR